MIKNVIKRTGEVALFDQSKITSAVKSALCSVYKDRDVEDITRTAEFISDKIVYEINNYWGRKISNNENTTEWPTVEEIQNVVEEVLMKVGEREAAKEYIIYRTKHQQLRENKSLLMDVDSIFEGYVAQSDWKVKENSNMGYSLQGLNNHIFQEVIKNIWLNRIYPEAIKDAHVEGYLHIHDLGSFAPYCCGWSLEDLLKFGFGGVQSKIESKPAKHLKTALGQLVNFFFTLQGEAAGAQAVSSFDTLLAPFVHKDKLNYTQVKQAIQEFVFNVNVPTRVGFQTPFVNITMDLQVPGTLKDVPAVIGGVPYENHTYKDFQKEMDLINEAFCEVMSEGDAKGRIFTFPIPTYNITKDFDWNRPIVDKLMSMTAKYGIPNFANYVNSDMSPDDARSMCCRLRLDNRELRKRGGGLFGANPLTGSIGVVTVNLPRLAYISETKEEFLAKLKRYMELAKTSLEIKRKLIEKNAVNGLYPYSVFYLANVHMRFSEYFKNHFSTIGLVGMNEAIQNLLGKKENITTEKGQKFAADVLDYMRDIITEYQVETGNLFNLEATPAEGTSYRLAKIDKSLYPDIICAGKDKPYYTNSTQLPVGFTDDIFAGIELQENLQTKYTGGTTMHIFMGERIKDPNVCKNLVRKIMETSAMPFFTITPTFSVCKDHGYLEGEQYACPHCGSKTEVWSRVVGYYRPVQCWNDGKQEEFKERKTYVVKESQLDTTTTNVSNEEVC